jgi:hypothetical protein
MAKNLVPRFVAYCHHARAAPFHISAGLEGYYHYCHDFLNLIKKRIEISNKLEDYWQLWQLLPQSKYRLMGITLIKFHAVGSPPY